MAWGISGCGGLALIFGGDIMPVLYKWKGITFAFESGIYLCLLSCLIAYSFIGVERCLDKAEAKKTIQVQAEDDDYHEIQNSQEIEIEVLPDQPKGWQAVKSFEKGVWLLSVDGAITYSTMLVQTVFGEKLLQERFGYKQEDASFTVNIPFTLCIILMPIMGLFIDKTGNRLALLYSQILASLIAIAILMATPNCAVDTWMS